MVTLIASSGIPWPELNAWAAAGTEFLGGLALVAGIATPLASVGLACVMLVALLTQFLGGLPSEGLIQQINYLTYLPEFLYVLLFVLLATVGPGRLSVDRRL